MATFTVSNQIKDCSLQKYKQLSSSNIITDELSHANHPNFKILKTKPPPFFPVSNEIEDGFIVVLYFL
jgi:hypothetical protein